MKIIMHLEKRINKICYHITSVPRRVIISLTWRLNYCSRHCFRVRVLTDSVKLFLCNFDHELFTFLCKLTGNVTNEAEFHVEITISRTSGDARGFLKILVEAYSFNIPITLNVANFLIFF